MNKFATDAASLGQGLSNSASALNLAGADLYESLAMITGITEITQDASGAGNALKISSMRLRGQFSSPFTVKTVNRVPLINAA